MIRPQFLIAAFLALATAMPAAAVPPPPPPTGSLQGPGPLCGPGFAIMLADDESADQHGANHWVVNGPDGSLGFRAIGSAESAAMRETLRERQVFGRTVVPGHGEIERHPVVEYPGDRERGWAYWLPRTESADAGHILVASDRFDGTAADHARLRRVLLGEARAALCAP